MNIRAETIRKEFSNIYNISKEGDSLRLRKKSINHSCLIEFRNDGWIDCTFYRANGSGISNTYWYVESVIKFIKEKF